MRQALKLHPDSCCEAIARIDVEIARPATAQLEVQFFVTGKLSDLYLPIAATPRRGDDLWQHTCLEAFARAAPGTGYCEFNFAPSMEWAAYHFDGYRRGMKVVTEMPSPDFDARTIGTTYQLKARLELDELAVLPGAAVWQLGASAVIEEISGEKSYWALAHPPGKPDFHHSEGFVHKLVPST